MSANLIIFVLSSFKAKQIHFQKVDISIIWNILKEIVSEWILILLSENLQRKFDEIDWMLFGYSSHLINSKRKLQFSGNISRNTSE